MLTILIFRYELIDILRNNNFNTPEIRISDVYVSNKRAKQTQRRILKGFNINTVETAIRESLANEKGAKKDFFKVVAKAIGNKGRSKFFYYFLSKDFEPIHLADNVRPGNLEGQCM